MQLLSWADLEAETERLDAAALATPDVDHYCSSSLWALPAHRAFAPHRHPWLFRSGESYALFAEDVDLRGAHVLQPLEPVWGLGSPLLGEPEPLLDELRLRLEPAAIDAVLITGITADGPMVRGLRKFGRWRTLRGQSMRRYVASLEGGVDGFLGRRSRQLRKSLRRGGERAQAMGLSFERASMPARQHVAREASILYDRILATEARSWKGQEGTGLASPEMRAFYADQIPRLLQRRALRLVFARQEDRDVGFILGGVLGETYRGLQFSYAAELEKLGLGGLLQVEAVRLLAEEGVRYYDLGSDVPYKMRWGERVHETLLVALVR